MKFQLPRDITHESAINHLIKKKYMNAAIAYIHCMDEEDFKELKYLVINDKKSKNPKAKGRGLIKCAIECRNKVIAEPDANTIYHQIHTKWKQIGKDFDIV